MCGSVSYMPAVSVCMLALMSQLLRSSPPSGNCAHWFVRHFLNVASQFTRLCVAMAVCSIDMVRSKRQQGSGVNAPPLSSAGQGGAARRGVGAAGF